MIFAIPQKGYSHQGSQKAQTECILYLALITRRFNIMADNNFVVEHPRDK